VPSIKKNRGGINTGGFPEKILLLSKYDEKMLLELHMNKSNKMMIERAAANLVARYFESYVDAKARTSPKSFHHIYEFDETGSKDARLFKRKITSTVGGTVISYNLINAKKPNREGYPFPQKAKVMEAGTPIVIKPKTSQFLQYRLSDGRFVRSSQSIVENPGGDVANKFTDEFNSFTSIKAKSVLKEYRFFEKVNDLYKVKRRLTIPRINSLSISSVAAQAASDAKQISTQIGAMLND